MLRCKVTTSRQHYVVHPLVWPETVEARLYQQAIAEKAYQRNTMVILPTALGKTVIAALFQPITSPSW